MQSVASGAGDCANKVYVVLLQWSLTMASTVLVLFLLANPARFDTAVVLSLCALALFTLSVFIGQYLPVCTVDVVKTCRTALLVRRAVDDIAAGGARCMFDVPLVAKHYASTGAVGTSTDLHLYVMSSPDGRAAAVYYRAQMERIWPGLFVCTRDGAGPVRLDVLYASAPAKHYRDENGGCPNVVVHRTALHIEHFEPFQSRSERHALHMDRLARTAAQLAAAAAVDPSQ